MKVTVYGESDVGRHRDHNEDAFLIVCDVDNKWQEINNLQTDLTASKGLFFAIADGMGGTNAGEIASSIAVNIIDEKVRLLKASLIDEQDVHKYLTSIVFDAHNTIVKKARKNKEMKGMGTTIVLGCILKDTFYVLWAGDSRVYVYNSSRHQQLIPFSEDHSLVWNRVKNGEITPEEARLSNDSNLILNALGDSFQKPMPDFKFTKLETGDRLILCSDGLNSMLSDSGIQQIIDFNRNTKDTCKALISAACNAGGHDNITVIVVDINDTELVPRDILPKYHKRGKWLRFGLILLLMMVIVSGIVFYSSEIASFFKTHLNFVVNNNNDSKIKITNETIPVETVKENKVVIDSEKSENITKSLYNKTSSKKEIDLKNGIPPSLNPLKIKEDLENEYLRIDILLKDLKRYKPDGDMYKENEVFCLANEKKIDNIIYKLDSIKALIKTVVYAPGDKIVSVKDLNNAEKILGTLTISIDNLSEMKEKILTNPKD